VSPLERPFRPADLTATALESFDLNHLAAQLVLEPQYEEEGKAGITLARDAHVSVVLAALRRGSELREHRAPASALVTLLSGRMTFVSERGSKRTEMVPGTLVAFAADLDHALVADEDSACLIVIGGRAGRR
jgi:quercetin dioxygenase-like cupin family protein